MPGPLARVLHGLGYDVARRDPDPPVPIGWGDVRRALGFQFLLGKMADVAGDVVECGVGRGASFVTLTLLTGVVGPARTVWGFDSFQGFPHPTAEDESPRRPRRGEWSVGGSEDIARAVRRSGIDASVFAARCRLVDGYFEESLGRYAGGPIALLHLDCDLYRSYRACLDVLFPRVAPGGAVVFDEYDDESFPGARRAVDEYLGDRARALRRLPYSATPYLVVSHRGET